MIRVWGGGIYEDEMFYSIADELGILIWQDFLFACGQYPCHKQYRNNVKREAVTQVKRLRKHPSVILFAGNNEDYQVAEASGLDWDPEDTNPENWLKTNFPARYIYEKILPEVVLEHAPDVFYHPGSPWGGGKPTRDKTVGDIHQWNGSPLPLDHTLFVVWHGSQEQYQLYPQLSGRFVSEFGMQALPSHRTITYFISSKQERFPQSQTMDHHNKATGFERRLGAYILENFRLQKFDLQEYGNESQRMQADALAIAYRGWRRLWKGPGEELCSGALVWQVHHLIFRD
jgi:beta-mannosidase